MESSQRGSKKDDKENKETKSVISKIEAIILVAKFLQDCKYENAYNALLKECPSLKEWNDSMKKKESKVEVKNLCQILSEYIVLKDEQKRRQTFSRSRGNNQNVFNILNKLDVLLEDYMSTRETGPATQQPQSQIQPETSSKKQEEPQIQITQPDVVPSPTNDQVLMPPPPPPRPQDQRPTPSPPSHIAPSPSPTSKSLSPGRRKKNITPKKLKLSPAPIISKSPNIETDFDFPICNLDNLDEQAFIQTFLNNPEFPEKLAEKINTFIPTLDSQHHQETVPVEAPDKVDPISLLTTDNSGNLVIPSVAVDEIFRLLTEDPSFVQTQGDTRQAEVLSQQPTVPSNPRKRRKTTDKDQRPKQGQPVPEGLNIDFLDQLHYS